MEPMVTPISASHNYTRFLRTDHGGAKSSVYKDIATTSVEPILPGVRVSQGTLFFSPPLSTSPVHHSKLGNASWESLCLVKALSLRIFA